jgi:glycosyltransferase involved in cell wall biosynthesis
MVVLPAFNAATTLERTIAELPGEIVDELLLVDDASQDRTVEVAARLGLPHVVHPRKRGYGGNQKTCYTEALRPTVHEFMVSRTRLVPISGVEY